MGSVLAHPVCSKYYRRVGTQDFKIGFGEMQGYRITMEDAYTINTSLEPEKHKDMSFFAIYDGHSGNLASQYCSDNMFKEVAKLKDPHSEKELQECVVRVDQEFMKNEAARNHGSTSCFAVVQKLPNNNGDKKRFRVTVANVGDSRAIVIGHDGQIRFSTQDHKPDDPKESKRIQLAKGSVSLGRVEGQLAMSRAIGDYMYKTGGGSPLDQKVIAVPDVTSLEVEEGELLLVCCDGLLEHLSNEQVVSFILGKLQALKDSNSNVDFAYIMGQLMDHSLQVGSKDNMSAMLIEFLPSGENNMEYESDEFVLGEYQSYMGDSTFVKAFIDDGKKHGKDLSFIQQAKERNNSMGEKKRNKHRE